MKEVTKLPQDTVTVDRAALIEAMVRAYALLGPKYIGKPESPAYAWAEAALAKVTVQSKDSPTEAIQALAGAIIVGEEVHCDWDDCPSAAHRYLCEEHYLATAGLTEQAKREVTDEMVERAVVAHETARRDAGWFRVSATQPEEEPSARDLDFAQKDREWMRAALEAALNG